ncbi:MAG: sodium/solute symporter [Pirellulaceae bacterium]
MSEFDWFLVFLLNGGVIVVGLYLARGTRSSSQWFLAGRSLPWWGIGLSMFATNVDNADLVAVTGSTYKEGLHIISVYALGSAAGGILAAFCVVPVIYRAGFYTNAEYLESRFGPSMRVLSALIQLQYRSSMLGLMIWSVYLLLTRLVDLAPTEAWGLIVGAVVFAGFYAAWGGLKAVVWTDALQGLIMMAGGLAIFCAVWNAVGGWSGLTESLQAADAAADTHLADLTHIGRYRGEHGATPPVLVVVAWTIIGCGYWTVNHTQTMRLMGARSLWDMRMAALFGVSISLPIMISCAFLGVIGRALPAFQGMDNPDELYPMLADEFLGWGWKGLVVAGVLSAAVSTFDSMGASLSAVFTRDIYARFIVKDRDDAHYVRVGRWATLGVLVLGFLYLPFIWTQENMLRAFTTLIPVFVTPLLTTYVVGVLLPVHRASGWIGIMIGSAYGLLALVGREFPEIVGLPVLVSGRWMALIWSLLITATTMVVVTLIAGRDHSAQTPLKESGWLGRSREQLPKILEHPFAGEVPLLANPNLWAALVLAGSAWVVFGLLW